MRIAAHAPHRHTGESRYPVPVPCHHSGMTMERTPQSSVLVVPVAAAHPATSSRSVSEVSGAGSGLDPAKRRRTFIRLIWPVPHPDTALESRPPPERGRNVQKAGAEPSPNLRLTYTERACSSILGRKGPDEPGPQLGHSSGAVTVASTPFPGAGENPV